MELILRAVYQLDEKETNDAAEINLRRRKMKNIEPYDFAVLAEVDDKIVGFTTMMYKPAINKFKHNAFIQQMSVDSEYKGLGIDEEMYYYLYSHLGDCSYLYAVTKDADLADLYKRVGFYDLGSKAHNTYVKTIAKPIKKTLFDAEDKIVPIGKGKSR